MSQKNESKARKLQIDRGVTKQLEGLPPKHCRQVTLAILRLLENATPHDSAALAGQPPLRRITVGEYRVIYRFDADTVYMSLVGKRNDDEVYRILKR